MTDQTLLGLTDWSGVSSQNHISGIGGVLSIKQTSVLSATFQALVDLFLALGAFFCLQR